MYAQVTCPVRNSPTCSVCVIVAVKTRQVASSVSLLPL